MSFSSCNSVVSRVIEWSSIFRSYFVNGKRKKSHFKGDSISLINDSDKSNNLFDQYCRYNNKLYILYFIHSFSQNKYECKMNLNLGQLLQSLPECRSTLSPFHQCWGPWEGRWKGQDQPQSFSKSKVLRSCHLKFSSTLT